MAKVLRIINRLNLGGPTYNVAYLTKYLAPEYETLLVAGMKSDTEESSEYIVRDLGLEPVYIKDMAREINLRNDLRAFREIKRIIQEYRPDIVHTHAAKAGTLGRLAALQCKVPVILHTFHGHVFHSYFGKLKTSLFKQIERYLASRTTGIIAISELQKKELCDQYQIAPPHKCHVIPLGFDLGKFKNSRDANRTGFRDRFKIQDDVILIGIIGRIVPVKNHSMFLEAFRLTLQKCSGKKVKAFIIGDGEDREFVINKTNELGLKVAISENDAPGADVIFTSWILNIEEPLDALDIIALTSDNEGTPVSLIEAQAAAKPVVSTDVGGIRDIVLEGRTAFLTKPGMIKDFSDKMIHLVDNQDLRIEMGSEGEKFVESRFNYSRLVKDMRELYGKLLTNVPR